MLFGQSVSCFGASMLLCTVKVYLGLPLITQQPSEPQCFAGRVPSCTACSF